ncbi:hypothetical protein ONE63_011493 [Megalurothrips usitatus]|uniref:Uncharacterized protein n=1 Tax=Megalurothrips usitatus TaxID=439358 RepID=A0AAV7X2P3_9NEOP|nr:hypothetical protein ONE63_011493 [Megalurothrips usitatus]
MDLSEDDERVDDPPERTLRADCKSTKRKRKDAFPIEDVLPFFTDLRTQLVVNGSLAPRNAQKEKQSCGSEDDGACEDDIKKQFCDSEQLAHGDSDDIKMYNHNFIISLSPKEWDSIGPEEASYNSKCEKTGKTVTRYYTCLKRRMWTNTVDDHFREHMRLDCKLTYTGGRIRQSLPYTDFKGVCEFCHSELIGEMYHAPELGRAANFSCTYTGSYKMKHPLLKRQIKGSRRDEYIDQMVRQNMSSSCVRTLSAEEKMETGEREPPQVPLSRSLRQAKYSHLSALRLHSDPVMAIVVAKRDILYSSFIKDVTYEKFTVHFWNMSQIHAERNYVMKTPDSKISIDASGGFAHKITRSDGKKSGHIFLTEGIIKDPKTKQQVAVACMLSERHDTETMRHWLCCWLRDGALIPKECDIDMSVALTAACVQAFAQLPSIQRYLEECAKILRPGDGVFVPPPCFIRYDVAHFMKLLSKLPCLNKDGVVKRTRQFYLRCLGQVIQCSQIDVIRQILVDIFTVALNESEGTCEVTEEDTPAQASKKRLINLIGNEAGDDLTYSSPEGMDRSAEEQLLEGFWTEVDSMTPQFGKMKRDFSAWGEAIFMEVVESNIMEGNWGNQQYLPELPKALLKLVDLLPMWSSIVVPHFGYGGPTASTTGSENNFNDTKHRAFGHIPLPIRVDEFLFFYIKVLSGKIKLSNAAALEEEDPIEHEIQEPGPEKKHGSESDGHNMFEPDSTQEEPNGTNHDKEHDGDFNTRNIFETDPEEKPPRDTLVEEESGCPSCTKDIYPDGEYSCFYCSAGIHLNSMCSVEVEGLSQEDKNVACIACSRKTERERLAIMEQQANDNWRGLSETKKRKRKSYLEKNSEWLSIDLNDNRSTVPVSLLKNGNSNELKPIKIKQESFVLTNTCPFDSVLQILATAFCDSADFQEYVRGSGSWELSGLIMQMATKGANQSTYRQRALLLKDHFPSRTVLGIQSVEIACHVERMLSVTSMNAPSGTQKIECTSSRCPRKYVEKEIATFTVPITKNNLKCIEEVILTRIQKSTKSMCREKMKEGAGDIEDGFAIIDPKWSKIPMCTGERSQTAAIGKGCLWVLLQDENPRKLAECSLQLGDLPSTIQLTGKVFHLRGVAGFSRPTSKHRGAIGHYRAYCHRYGKWEVYDDLANSVFNCSPSEKVVSHAVCYSI